MRLGINGWRACGLQTGVGRYLLNLLTEWRPEVTRAFDRVTLYTPKPINRTALALPNQIRDVVLGPAWRMLLWENARLGPFVTDDVLFCPSFSRPFVTRARTVVATHDMVFRVHPDLYPLSMRFYSRLYEWSDRLATLVVTDSEAVKDEIVHYCRVPASKVRVTYLAPAPCFAPMEAPDTALADIRRRYIGEDVPFFLFVGKITGRRSLPLLLEAFALLKRRTTLEHRLLLVGAGTDSPALVAASRRLNIDQAVSHAGYMPDGVLNAVYNTATALVSAAVYETSSLPVMEAQAAGLPVICFRNPGMSEITGNAAEMYERAEADALCDAMVRVAESLAHRQDLATRGLISARRFSWARCARETMAVLEEAATL
jgi:glycosyltransferase involved in cell wall biosynthesis